MKDDILSREPGLREGLLRAKLWECIILVASALSGLHPTQEAGRAEDTVVPGSEGEVM